MTTTTKRGLGWDHQKTRERLLRTLVDGTPCWWCNQPMHRDPAQNFDRAPLEADHSRSRARHGTAGNRADRLLHRRCNRQRQDGTKDHQRPALQTSEGPPHVFPWPEGWGPDTSHA